MRSVFRITAAAVLAATVFAGGCANQAPSQVDSAAIIGDTSIPLKRVQDQIEIVLDKEGDQARAELTANRQLDDVSRQVVTHMIRTELIQTYARRHNITVTSQDVSKLLYELGGPETASRGSIWNPEQFRERVRDQLQVIEIGRESLDTSVTVDYTTATTREAAIARAEQLAAAGARGARQMIKDDVDAGRDAALDQRVVSGDDPIFATSPAFAVPEGTVVAFQTADTQPWLVMVVKNRTEGATPSDQAPDVDQIDQDVLQGIGLRQLYPIAQELGVRLNPRFGVWDPVNLQAVPTATDTGAFAVPLAAAPA